MAILLTFFFYQVYMSGTQTALVVSEPEHYLETLQDIEHSDHNSIIMQGLSLDQMFAKSDDPLWQKIHARSEKIASSGGSAFSEAANRVRDSKAVAFCDDIPICAVLQGFVCINSDCDPRGKFQVSKPFGATSYTLLAYSKYATRKIKNRFKLTHFRLIQSGVYLLDHNEIYSRFEPLVASYQNKFRSCIWRLSRKEEPESEIPAVTFHSFVIILRIPGVMWTSAVVTLILEFIRKRIKAKPKQTQIWTHASSSSSSTAVVSGWRVMPKY
jgi:hypothetical protein